jgi:hypothetical protein
MRILSYVLGAFLIAAVLTFITFIVFLAYQMGGHCCPNANA